jgi:hypothetical protein
MSLRAYVEIEDKNGKVVKTKIPLSTFSQDYVLQMGQPDSIHNIIRDFNNGGSMKKEYQRKGHVAKLVSELNGKRLGPDGKPVVENMKLAEQVIKIHESNAADIKSLESDIKDKEAFVKEKKRELIDPLSAKDALHTKQQISAAMNYISDLKQEIRDLKRKS